MNRIRFLREERGMTQAELGKLLNVRDSAVSKYEMEKVPLTAETLIRLASIFGVSVDYLIFQSEERNPGEHVKGTSFALPQIVELLAEHPELVEAWLTLEPEAKSKAIDYVQMLRVLQDMHGGDQVIDSASSG